MKALTFFLALATTIAFSVDVDAQRSRRNYPGTGATSSTTDGGGYASTASRNDPRTYRGADNRRLTRRERARWTRRLEERAFALDDFAADLRQREAILEGRRSRATRRPSRRYYTRGDILSAGELANWRDRLDRREARLLDREREVLRLERRQRRRPGSNFNRNRRNNGRQNNGGGGGVCPPAWG